MVMTNEEIIRHYRQAKDKNKDVEVLADLNLTSQDTIREILIEAGAMRRSFTRKPKDETVEKEAQTSKAQEKKPAKTHSKHEINDGCYISIESIISNIPTGASVSIRKCAYTLCMTIFTDYLKAKLRVD